MYTFVVLIIDISYYEFIDNLKYYSPRTISEYLSSVLYHPIVSPLYWGNVKRLTKIKENVLIDT